MAFKGKAKGPKDPYSSIRCSNSKFCSSYLYSPIFRCTCGHNICTTCASFYNLKCPICSSEATYTVNLNLERISSKLLEPCCNRSLGCHFQFPLVENILHQRICRYSEKSCFSSKCKWKGPLGTLVEHMESVHRERVYKESEVVFSVRNVSWRTARYDTISYIYCELGNFWVRVLFDGNDREFYGAVQYIGPQQEAEKLECQFEMQEKTDEGELTGLKCVYNGPIYTENLSFDDIFDEEDCFNVAENFAEYFEHDGVIEVIVKVKKSSEAYNGNDLK